MKKVLFPASVKFASEWDTLLKTIRAFEILTVHKREGYLAAVKKALTTLEHEFHVSHNNADLDGSRWSKVAINTLKHGAIFPTYPGQVTGFWTRQGIRTYQTIFSSHHCDIYPPNPLLSKYESSGWDGRLGSWCYQTKYREITNYEYDLSNLSDYDRQGWDGSLTSWYDQTKYKEITNYEDDPSPFIVSFNIKSLLIDQKSTSNQYSAIQGLRELQSFADILNYIHAEEGLADQIQEALQKSIEDTRKQLNHYFHAILVAVSRLYKSKKGIGKGVEGYIPFLTWARGSLRAQLVVATRFIDKLSQPNQILMEMSHGC